MSTTANPTAFEAWNGDSGRRWVASADLRDRVLAPTAIALLDAAQPAAGDEILDVGCGCGATTFLAASAVGSTGSVVGVDISAPMLEVAQERADAASIANASFVQADVQIHDFAPESVDMVISRFGTMFFADPTAAFANMASALRPGGRLCLATWRRLEDNEWLIVPGAALLEHTELPEAATDEPGMFAQADPQIVESVLGEAGFADISLEATDVTFTLGPGVDGAVDYLADSGPGRALLETIDDVDAREAALDDVRRVLANHLDGDGVHLGGGIWIITATRST